MENKKKLRLKNGIGLLFAIFLAIGSVVYIMYHSAGERAYNEKWGDYDDCGT